MSTTPDTDAASAGPIHVAAAGIQARLQAVFPKPRFTHQVLPAPMSLRLLAEMASVRTPFVGLAFLGLKPMTGTGRMFKATLRWGIYLVTQNPRPAARLLGDTLGPGLAQMVHAAIVGVHGFTIPHDPTGALRDGDVGTIELGDADNSDGSEWGKENVACAALTATVTTAFTSADSDAFLRLVSAWTFDGPTDAAVDTFERSP